MKHSQISYFSNQIDRSLERLGNKTPRSIILEYESAWGIKSDELLARKLRSIKWQLDKLVDQTFNFKEG